MPFLLPADLDAEQVRDFVLTLIDRGLSPATTNSTLSALRFLYVDTLGCPERAWPGAQSKAARPAAAIHDGTGGQAPDPGDARPPTLCRLCHRLWRRTGLRDYDNHGVIVGLTREF